MSLANWRIGIAVALVTTVTISFVTATTTPAQAVSDPFDATHAAQSRGDYQTAIRLYGEALESGRIGAQNRARVYLNRGSALRNHSHC